MSSQTWAAGPANSAQQKAGELRYVARQPILDMRGKVHGYELLFWNGNSKCSGADSDLATRAMLDNAVIFGLEELSLGLPAFVRCTADSIVEDWVQVLPPQSTVLELPAGIEATQGMLAACRKLKAEGFRLALSEFTGMPETMDLVPLADYVKVNIETIDAVRRGNLPRVLKPFSACMLAEHVETHEIYGQLCREGYELFQGYYFCSPEPLDNRKIPGNRLVHLEILEDLQQDPADLKRLSQLVMCDASLTYRLLRLVNSPLCAMRQAVTSIQSALMLVGESAFRRMAMLAIAGDFNAGQSPEILRMAFERGRFCELAAGLCGLEPSEQYIIGMVSLFPAMLRIVMEDLVKLLPLRAKACDALLGKESVEGILLHWMVCQEHGDWLACDKIARANNLRAEELVRCQGEAVAWAQAALRSNA